MGVRVRFSPEEVRSTQILDPGVYGFTLTKVKDKVDPKTKERKIVLSFDGFTGRAKGITVYKSYNEEYFKYLWALVEKGFGVEGDDEAGTDIDFDALVNRKIWLVIEVSEWGGSPQNNVNGFKPWEEGGLDESQAESEAA